MTEIPVTIHAFQMLLNYTASGIGAVAGPVLANWRAKKEGNASLTAVQFEAKIREIEAESRGKSLVIIAEAQAKARKVIDSSEDSGSGIAKISRDEIIQTIEFQGRKRLANYASVVSDAANQLGDKEVPIHEPDHDWTARFFDCIQDVSSEDMQSLWAQVLAGEVESPGRTSLRTLDILRNMTQRDAEMFSNICGFVFNNDFLFYGTNEVGDSGPLIYNNLLHLQDCGLVNVGPNLVKLIQWTDSSRQVFPYHEGAIMIDKGTDRSEKIEIPEVILTTAGRELCRLIPTTFQLAYLQRFSTFLKSKNCSLSYLENVRYLHNGSIRYSNQTLIEPSSTQS